MKSKAIGLEKWSFSFKNVSSKERFFSYMLSESTRIQSNSAIK